MLITLLSTILFVNTESNCIFFLPKFKINKQYFPKLEKVKPLSSEKIQQWSNGDNFFMTGTTISIQIKVSWILNTGYHGMTCSPFFVPFVEGKPQAILEINSYGDNPFNPL